MMKRGLGMLFVVVGCGEMPSDEAVTEDSITPSIRYTVDIPAAPASIGVVQWRRGMRLIPAGYNPRSFFYVYSGIHGLRGRVQAAGFDVIGHVTLFEVELNAVDIDFFLDDLNDTSKAVGLTSGGGGNVTPKCCVQPGFTFHGYAWGTAYVQHDAYESLYQ